MLIALDALFRELDITPLGGKGSQGETHCVSAILFHYLQGVDDIPLGFTHLLSLFVPDKGVEIDKPKGHFPHEVDSHHHHACHPEK